MVAISDPPTRKATPLADQREDIDGPFNSSAQKLQHSAEHEQGAHAQRYLLGEPQDATRYGEWRSALLREHDCHVGQQPRPGAPQV